MCEYPGGRTGFDGYLMVGDLSAVKQTDTPKKHEIKSITMERVTDVAEQTEMGTCK